jgi:hypothetical protein
MNRQEAEQRLRDFFLSLIETCRTEEEAMDCLQQALRGNPELFESFRGLTGESGEANTLFDDPAVVAKLEKLAQRSSAWLN